MKGVDNSLSDHEGMTHKPIITCKFNRRIPCSYLYVEAQSLTSFTGAGDWNLFCTLEQPLVAAIPQDSCEWRRSYGRITKLVSLEASFIKFNKDKLKTELNLLNRPIFHIYWTDCVVKSFQRIPQFKL